MKQFIPLLALSCISLATVLSCNNNNQREVQTSVVDSIQAEPLPKKHKASEWTIDTSASKMEFTIKHFGLDVKGTFSGFKGKVFFDENHPEGNSVEISIDAATVNTANEKRDKDLRTAKYFDAEQHPLIVYRADSIVRTGDTFMALGTLMIKGISRSCDIPFTFGKSGNRNVFSGIATLHRLDFEVGEKNAVMGNDVKVSFSILAGRK